MEQRNREVKTLNTKQESHAAQRIVGTIFGVVEVVLAFRLILKLLGANPANDFVQGVYFVTHYITVLFEGIFSLVSAGGAETTAIFEPATLIAMVVIAVIAWFVLRLITPRISNRSEKTEYTEGNHTAKDNSTVKYNSTTENNSDEKNNGNRE